MLLATLVSALLLAALVGETNGSPKAFLAKAATDVGQKVVDRLGDRIAEGVVENHQEKVVSSLENYFSGQFDKADDEFDELMARGGNLLSGLGGDVEQNIIDGATVLGVGFDGHGEYSTDSRKKSLIQRSCDGKQGYKEYHVPDTMTVQGIYDTDVAMYSFSSVEEYRHYLEDKSAMTSQTESFILRYGTHYTTSAKFGGQLKIIKTKEASEEASQENFAQAAQSDFKKVFSTYSAQQTQTKSSSWFHDHETKTERSRETATANSGTSSSGSLSEEAAL
uniref:MACPF domain-containing protein n=1 Tax=Branchiostoma floridae TaxID=7739 RepID=C3ZVU2_BRAFL|eukprot:XP_002587346.1 hypothetical protein BRAFLDRAFT_100544 [Branchiostoma floridae]